MAEYKKKHIGKRNKAPKNAIHEDIKMKSHTTPNKKNEPKITDSKPSANNTSKTNNPKIRVIAGYRLQNVKKRNIIIMLTALLVVAFIVFSVFTPTGAAEYITNSLALIGSGSGYPVSLSGGNLVNTVNRNNVCYLVSSTNVEGYNSRGKCVFSYQHSYNAPMMKVSASRFITYDQGGTGYAVYNLKNKLYSSNSENEILSAAISRNGFFAIATLSDSYSSQVKVFNKNNNVVYEWFCSDEIINDVLLSSDGKTMVISAVNAENGSLVSKIYVVKYASATPIHTFTYNDFVYSLESYNGSNFCAVFESHTDFYDWKKFNKTELKDNNFTADMCGNSSFLVVATSSPADKSRSRVYITSKSSSIKYSFDFEGHINDISVKGKNIYILGDKTIHVYSVKGQLITKTACDFGIQNIFPISRNEVAGISESNITKIQLQ